MTETARSNELRERMERVATKPRSKVAVVQGRAKPRPASNRARPALKKSPARPAAVRASRFGTLLAWGRWELIDVPASRIEWLMGVARGRPGSGAAARTR